MGLQSLSGGAPSRNAIFDPLIYTHTHMDICCTSVSLRKRFKAVRTTVADRSSGFTNARALLMAMKT
eukprot:858924-Amorphochlora_amoeboformis.AAC.1